MIDDGAFEPCFGRALRVAASFVDQVCLDPRQSDSGTWLMFSWRCVRRGAILRGLLSAGRGSQNLAEIALRPTNPFERPFDFEQDPPNAALLDYLRSHPCPLLPSPEEHPGYYEILADELDVEHSLSTAIGLHRLVLFGTPTLAELIRFEPKVVRQCSAMVREVGMSKFAEDAEIRWGWTTSESQAALAQVVAAQAADVSIHDPETLIAAQIQAMERLAAQMEAGPLPDLRGAAMIRREISRLLLRSKTESNETAELARFIGQLGPELDSLTPVKHEEVEEVEEL